MRVDGGCTWGEVDRATNAHGLATPSGIISTTGVGGLTLGGGLGHLTRKCGLTIDNLLEADVVLADGERVRASADENPDLFWAIRGGGGNFGVVTSFMFRLHDVDTVVAGPTFWAVEQSAEVLRGLPRLHPRARRASSTASSPPAPVPPGAAVPGGAPPAQGLRRRLVLRRRRRGRGREGDGAAARRRARAAAARRRSAMPHPALQGAFDGLYPQGDQWYWRADFVNEIPDEAVEMHAKFGAEMPTLEVDHAPVPDRRRRPRRRRDRHGLELPRRQLGLGLRRRRPRPGERRRDPATGPSTTSRPCTRTRPAAPT